MLMHITSSTRRQPRRGIILLVVISMLALFAVLGLSFVYYAQAEADAARLSTEAQSPRRADIDPEFLLSFALGQLIYDREDMVQYGANHGVYSSLRGHSLARTMYGYSRNGNASAYPLNCTPFNGIARPSNITDGNVGVSVDRLVNFKYFPADGFVRDPGHYADASKGQKNRTSPLLPVTLPYTGENPDWTYADVNNMFLAQMNAKGEIIIPSFWRPWISNTAPVNFNLSMDPSDPNYTKIWGKNVDATVSPTLKYMTLRPLPCYNAKDSSGNALFPAPEDGGGDVKNFEGGLGISNGAGGYYNNDSIWLDIGAPVLTAPDGRKYKPLFAFLIVDLDGKVNINAAGNVRRYDPAATPMYGHGSNQGFFPTEINLGKIFSADQTEWQNILAYRYGNDGRPGTAVTQFNNGGVPSKSPYYGLEDFDGVKNDPNNKNDANNKYYTSERWELPGASGNSPATVPFWYLPKDTYQNGTNTGNSTAAGTSELQDHPAQYDYFDPSQNNTVDDQGFRLSNMEALLRYRGTGSPSLTSDFFFSPRLGRNLLNLNLNDTTNDPDRRRWRMFTTHSMDMARPGIAPWLSDPANTNYQFLNATDPYPTGGATAVTFATDSGEFAMDLRGVYSAITSSRLNLQKPVFDSTTNAWRGLTRYPAPDAKTGVINTADPDLQKAIDDRQQFAQNLFNRLRFVTTGARPGSAFPAQGTGQYNALRWLAQLAANIVDYIDEDNINTTFIWYRDPMDATKVDYVVGTELPRLLINEVYAQINNAPGDDMAVPTMDFKVNFWVELVNPMLKVADPLVPDTTDPGNLFGVRLQTLDPTGMVGQTPIYKLTIIRNDNDPDGGDPKLRGDVANALGAPNYPNAPDPNFIRLEVADFQPKMPDVFVPSKHAVVEALGTNTTGPNGDNKGFYVLGPQTDFPSNMAMNLPQATLKVDDTKSFGTPAIRSAMTYDYPKDQDPSMIKKHTILLRRLANPGLKHEPDPTKPQFNPYVTVDYVEKVNVAANDGVEFDIMPNNGAHVGKVPVEMRKSVGRRQVYAAEFNQWAQQAPATALTDQPQNTFFSHNTPLTSPFDWLAFLDRVLMNPIELMQVSSYRPHELTQQFITVDGMMNQKKHTHVLNQSGQSYWRQSDNRLYRFLEYVDAGWRTKNVTDGGRYPGKININTIWDKEIFQALCDRNDAVYFQDTDVDNIFNNLKLSRTPSGAPGSSDKPFRGFAAPYTVAGTDGIESTFLRNYSGSPLFKPATTNHPVQETELLAKIFNNVTTRSNVFAVWMTVGYFEVHDDPAVLGNYLLGKEIGRDENRHVRHRMFAIVDRTALIMPKNLAALTATVGAGANQTAAVSGLTSSISSPYRVDFTLQAGMQVEVGVGTANVETITIKAVSTTPAAIIADFQKAHNPGDLISVPRDQAVDVPMPATYPAAVYGNAGPQFRFDHRHAKVLVPYYSIIQ